ncbi:hypothetical protein [Corallococcus caeni]|uniref:Uncharacterized protein n=1 Tax=Corallococcus caeni TaxID=3082388 RepID=A0ABQ6QTL8_9BACT|nr:hypothetical protein ASNO1_35990 [Corallococcus sp. NO1]
MPAYKEASWSGVLGLAFEVSIWKNDESRRRAVCVSVSGQYRAGPKDPEGGVVIAMIVAAAMANPRGPCGGLVLDIRELEYRSGDMLFYWRDSLNQFRLPSDRYPCALACSDRNVKEVRSLLKDEGRTDLLETLSMSLEDALACVLVE